MSIHPDLEWLAREVSEWASKENLSMIRRASIGAEFYDPEYIPRDDGYTQSQWLQARKDLGLIMSDEEESMPAKEHRNKYMREIKPGVWVDVYSVLVAFNVTNPADAHAIKKMLMPGRRGTKDSIQDREEAIASIKRAIEIESDSAHELA